MLTAADRIPNSRKRTASAQAKLGDYADIQSASLLPAGMEAPGCSTRRVHRSNDTLREELDALPNFRREKIQASQAYGVRLVGLGFSEDETIGENFDPADVPF